MRTSRWSGLAGRVGAWTVTVLLLWVATRGSEAVAADLTGHWRLMAGGSDEFVDIVQTGSAVTLTYDVSGYVFDGTVAGTEVTATSDDAPCPASLWFQSWPDDSFLEGVLTLSGACFPSKTRTSLSRCECFDGNVADGDGCDSECRTEPCFVCSGEPSTCTPAADASPCDDRRDCTAGETCTGGVCGGGSAVTPPCIDLTGLWRGTSSTFAGVFISRFEIRQRDGILVTRALPEGTFGAVGTVDPVSGALDLAAAEGHFICADAVSHFEGTAAADGLTYSGNGTNVTDTLHGCVSHAYQGQGTRCGGGSLDPGEACDDGNATDGDGCDIGCAVEPCFQCSGDPSVCTPLPDATPCDDGAPCTLAGTCSAGSCVVTSSLECAPCTVCDGAGACEPGPRDDCRGAVDPSATRLQLTNRSPDVRDALRWKWRKGAATTPPDLGQPNTTSAVALCLFDESGADPNLIFAATVPPGGSCAAPPCWTQKANGSYLYRDAAGTAAGITSLALNVGAAGKASVLVRGKGAGLAASPLGFPNPALPLPLRAQVQVSDGACFEATIDASGVRKNADGILRATGTP